jgi:phenylacetic acid degradation operon negative regulatory protein
MPKSAASAATAIVARFRRQRPLRGGSLLITVFGDAIAPRGGAITLGSLIDLAGPLGLNERLVRTAMARLADDGWLENRRQGRLSEYRLSRDGRERFAAATRQIYAVPDPAWQGAWTLVLLPTPDRNVRTAAREVLGWLGFGEPTPGVFVHPMLPGAEVDRALRGSPALADAIVLASTQSGSRGDRQLARLGWDLADLAARYRRFIAQFAPARATLDDGTSPEPLPGFQIRTLLIHEYRKIHLRDPLLPAALLPADWVGTDAYRLCREIYERVAEPAERHLSACGARLDGPLPPATAELSGRFGGLRRTRG